MDIRFMQEQLPLYTEAAKITIYIALIGIVCSILLGMICSIVRYFRIPVLSWIVSCYIELSRNTPLLIQLFFLYFGLPKAGIVLSSEACAIIGLTFQGGSYMAEVFRSGLENVSTIQKESALALGMKKSQVLIHIILPQALANSIPAICANMIFLIKDLMFVTKDLIGIYYKTDEALFMLVIAYLVILLPVSLLCSLVERRIRYGEYGA